MILEDRSLSSGMSLPKWMKNKMTDRFDLDQSNLSPTDDSFMYYYRYPSSKTDPEAMKDATAVQGTLSQVTLPYASDNPSISKVRPKGTDDGFKSETAQVGTSILRVANQIVSGRVPTEKTPEPAEECEQLLAKFDPYRRRGSKSLPASPLTSPKAKRKMNRYFTSPYVESDKSKGWILSGLLAKREISHSMGFIGEEKKEELDRASSTVSVDEVSKSKNQVFKAKPSELREMNFWSPTSM
ncbi:uncharacterized protein LOC115882683 isoform X2 [Sitophilus oryzae]|uniref:Uncharacterized protein LOC115882683 isoform X2 n=1 Tax=Sitophilus oryzae TaxID=7048 RepID=A0A6J2XZ60_SITOR|nr:uncharacterized protein LOC115882683 isoform X2 [Sitophilus oryzae]XP_030756737.1 uncharacterized protein LOC115882683 isoform X2 [Sitophilus oryzae]